MPPNNCDHEATLLEASSEDRRCPKCNITMEPIDSSVEGPPLQDLQLCPGCYLVMWHDENGFQTRQGVPMNNRTRDRSGADIT